LAIREILRLGNPILFEKCEEIEDFNSTKTTETIRDLHLSNQSPERLRSGWFTLQLKTLI